MRLKISTGEFCPGAVMGVRVDIRILYLRRAETVMETGIRVHRWSMDPSSGRKLRSQDLSVLWCGVNASAKVTNQSSHIFRSRIWAC